MGRAFDVVIAPDFRSPARADFETRTLFFLASWMENAGRARGFPLHIACVGDPPGSVRTLASRCGASITVHSPLDAEPRRTSNKLRGLEVHGAEDRVLLLDVDVLVLSDPSGLSDLGACIAAAPAIEPRVPEGIWARIYRGLGMEVPPERIASVRGRLDCPYSGRSGFPERKREMARMVPYYAGGVLFAPWSCGLRSLWDAHIRKIIGLFDEGDPWWDAVSSGDQTGLSTAIERLRLDGLPVRPLPEPFQANWLHVYRRVLSPSDIRLFHAFRFARNPAAGRGPGAHLRRYRALLALGMCVEAARQDLARLRATRAARDLPGAVGDALSLGAMLERLYRKHVAPVL